MSIHVYEKGDFISDPGNMDRTYPIPENKVEDEIAYDRQIQPLSVSAASIVGVFNDWIQSFFVTDYFKHVHIKSEASFAAFKSFMRNIYKKEKPLMVIDPRTIEVTEDSLFAQNMLNRYNYIDPEHDNIGAKLLYSLPIMKTDMFELVYRRNRYRFEFDVMIMEQTLSRQLDTYNTMLMNIRHNSKFTLPRMVPFYIPERFIQNIAKFHGFDWTSDAFLKFMNANSVVPIIKRYLPNGHVRFFFQKEMNIQVEVPSFPSRDTPEMSDAIEWGARIVDSFTFIADIPSEYVFLTPITNMTLYDTGIENNPDDIRYVSSIYADLDWPDEIDGYKLTNRVDIMLQDEDNEDVDIISVIKDYNPDIHTTIHHFIQNRQKLSDLVKVRVYPNGSYQEFPSTLNNSGMLHLHNPQKHKIYTVNVYVNLDLVNIIKNAANTQCIGTVEKY